MLDADRVAVPTHHLDFRSAGRRAAASLRSLRIARTMSCRTSAMTKPGSCSRFVRRGGWSSRCVRPSRSPGGLARGPRVRGHSVEDGTSSVGGARRRTEVRESRGTRAPGLPTLAVCCRSTTKGTMGTTHVCPGQVAGDFEVAQAEVVGEHHGGGEGLHERPRRALEQAARRAPGA